MAEMGSSGDPVDTLWTTATGHADRRINRCPTDPSARLAISPRSRDPTTTSRANRLAAIRASVADARTTTGRTWTVGKSCRTASIQPSSLTSAGVRRSNSGTGSSNESGSTARRARTSAPRRRAIRTRTGAPSTSSKCRPRPRTHDLQPPPWSAPHAPQSPDSGHATPRRAPPNRPAGRRGRRRRDHLPRPAKRRLMPPRRPSPRKLRRLHRQARMNAFDPLRRPVHHGRDRRRRLPVRGPVRHIGQRRVEDGPYVCVHDSQRDAQSQRLGGADVEGRHSGRGTVDADHDGPIQIAVHDLRLPLDRARIQGTRHRSQG
jgi:hypothetical protein